MKVQIANPIYDVVFKYMMEDNLVAKLLISSIIGEQVVELEPKPQEHTTEKKKRKGSTGDDSSLTVYRLDFSAKIKTPNGDKLIIIELQKASVPTDIMRFRSYLGKQYCDVSNNVMGESGKSEPVQIYTIYFLGRELGICDTPVLSVNPVVIDMATNQIVKEKNEFIDLLNHKCWIVQISCLKQRRRNELEKLLSVFDQSNRTADIHILNISEKDFPEKYRPLIRRLKMAASNQKVKKQMEEEDGIISYLKDIERDGYIKARKEFESKMAKALKKIEAKDKTINIEKEKNKAKEKEIKEKNKEIAELKRLYNKKRVRNLQKI